MSVKHRPSLLSSVQERLAHVLHHVFFVCRIMSKRTHSRLLSSLSFTFISRISQPERLPQIRILSLSVKFQEPFWRVCIKICKKCAIRLPTGYGVDGRGSNPGRGKIFMFSTASRPAMGPTQPPIQWVPGTISPGLKRPKREGDNSPPSSAEVKNDAATTPLPHTSLGHNAYPSFCLTQ
jgi:hypothetical protein